jgi:hypothetical protein
VAAITLAMLSFVYGVLHAIGPGHGKTIISSYVVANEETVRRGVIISFIAAGLQALSAIVLVGVLLIALGATGLQVNAWSNQLEDHRLGWLDIRGHDASEPESWQPRPAQSKRLRHGQGVMMPQAMRSPALPAGSLT